jgi:hypothetical protein
MAKPQIAKDPGLPVNRETIACEASACEAWTMRVVVLGVDFRSKRRERVYDPEKVWSGEHTIRDYTEI